MSRRILVPLVAFALLSGLALVAPAFADEAAAPTRNAVEGVWVTGDGEGWVEIARQGDSLVGTILGGPKGDDRLDEHNPDPALRSRRLTGLRILEGFAPDGPGKWVDGTIYDPNNGKTYGCTLELEGEDTLKVRGYLGVSLFGRTEKWTRKPGS